MRISDWSSDVCSSDLGPAAHNEDGATKVGRIRLTDEQMGDFRRDGFLVVRGMFSAAEMRRIESWTCEVDADPEAPGKYMMYFEKSLKDSGERILNRLENFYPYHAGFRDLFDGDKLRCAVSDLFGEPAILFKDKINFKKPGATASSRIRISRPAGAAMPICSSLRWSASMRRRRRTAASNWPPDSTTRE